MAVSSMGNGRIIGFSIRVPHEMVSTHWDAARRRLHLAKPQVANPLSIDDAVWPFPVDVDEFLTQVPGGSLGEVDANPLNLMPAILEEWVRHGLPPTARTRYRLVAAFVEESDYSGLKKIYPSIVKPSTEKLAMFVSTHWCNLGFDVMDQTGVSGLMNCGIGEAMSQKERGELAEGLNEHGLVNVENVAKQLATALNLLVPEHQPFLPVRLLEAPY